MIFGIAPPTAREWLFSAKTFAASMLALYIALAAGLPRPYWAMATVFIVAHPLSGATRSKAVYRLAGTLAGATAAVFFVPLFVNAPLVLSAVVAMWTGGLLFLSFLDRTPRAYAFMLAGYSLPLIALPAVGDPATVFDIALARSQEIGLGIVCASLVNALVLPGKIGPLIGTMVSGWQKDAGGWIVAVLAATDNEKRLQESARLATDVRALDALISQLQYDPEMRAVVRHARDLRARLAVLPPLLSSLADRLRTVRRLGLMTDERKTLLADIAAWIGATPASASEDVALAETMRGRLVPLFGDQGERSDWQALILASAGARLREIVDLWQDANALRAQILAGRDAGRRQALRLSTVASPVPHFDLGLMAFSAGSAVLATFVACVVWITSGWDQGAGFVIIAAVSCSFFATSDNPVPQIRMLTILTAVSAGVAGIYLFAILPNVHTFLGLVLSFAPTFLVLGTLITRPQFFFIAMLLAVNTASLVSLQEIYAADFTSFVNSSIASVGGGLFALVWMTATRPFGAAYAARRLVRAGWAEIAAIAGGRRGAAPEAYAGRVFDRLGQLLPRLAQGAGGEVTAADVLVEMRVGLNVVDLRRLLPEAPRSLQAALGTVLAGVADNFGAQALAGRCQPAATELLPRIDAALAEGLAAPAGDVRTGVLQALVGLRLALFAEAPDPAPLALPASSFSLAAE
jgi:uncharacterized membrane protein YccC